eukprot:TRINITY_DN6408_c0_g1_i1.p1 TRINITY_DN6408_c0_g1~~TRINITY_DN6408_c0_g1_i1.p1  ORF type:complete len:286 (+),score=77.10 TRINITY_DN6408_c0_g1_i1:373-1230(+)
MLRRLRCAATAVALYLLNPVAVNVSSRGNADSLTTLPLLWSLHCLQSGRWWSAGVALGVAAHLRLFPLVLMPSAVLFAAQRRRSTAANGWAAVVAACCRAATVVGGACAAASFCAAASWLWCGQDYVDEAVLYHFGRKDHRHNLSPVWLPVYLSADTAAAGIVAAARSLGPRAVAAGAASVWLSGDLPLCWLAVCASFVALNTVCTVQYFLWYLCLLPCALRRRPSAAAVAAPVATLAVWMWRAYRLEFGGDETYVSVWVASCCFVAAQTACICDLLRSGKQKAA